MRLVILLTFLGVAFASTGAHADHCGAQLMSIIERARAASDAAYKFDMADPRYCEARKKGLQIMKEASAMPRHCNHRMGDGGAANRAAEKAVRAECELGAQFRADAAKQQKKSQPKKSSDACVGDATSKIAVKDKINNGYYDYTIANTSACPICLVYDDCSKASSGSAKCSTKKLRLGKSGSASGDIAGSNFKNKPKPRGAAFCR